MIYEHLIHGEYLYTVVDLKGNCIAETYDLNEAEQILAQYRTRLQAQDHSKHLYKGILPDPIRSK